MDKSDLAKIHQQFNTATNRLAEALEEDKTKRINIDGSIQRFEFCFELCWKMIRRHLEYKGISVRTPRDAFKEAFKLGWLKEGDTFWSQMIEDRNLTSHTYNEATADSVYSNLSQYLRAYMQLAQTIDREFSTTK